MGIMTRSVLSAADSGADLPAAARKYCEQNPRCAGNGSLMRTAPVALAHGVKADQASTRGNNVSNGRSMPRWPSSGDRCATVGVITTS